MSTNTNDLGLKKPVLATDNFSQFITDLADNFQKLDDSIGKLTDLSTTEKADLVKALNEVKASIPPDSSSLAEQVQTNTDEIGSLLGFLGLSNYRLDYTYNADNSVNTVTTKDGNGNVVMTTTYAYLANGDVDTSTSVVNGQTITIKFNYDANGNVLSQVPTIS